MAIAVETDETVDKMVECLMDISALAHGSYQIPKTESGKDQVAALVTKLLSRTEMLNDPEALQKVRDEAGDLVNEGAWEYESVREKEHVRAEAKASGVSVHFGKLMTIASMVGLSTEVTAQRTNMAQQPSSKSWARTQLPFRG